MQFGRMAVSTPDGRQTRIVVRQDASSDWFDVRAAYAQQLVASGASAEPAGAIASATVPGSLSRALQCGEVFLDVVTAVLSEPVEAAKVMDPALTNALDPTSYRDFMVFQEHFSFGYRWQNKPVPDVMYELPVSYAGDPLSFIGSGEEIPWPSYSDHLDYELELGIVIGKSGRDLTPDEALDHVLGLTILNDVSARDIQAREMTGGLGPSKGKHFACVTGPLVTTLDAIPETGLRMTATVNGETWCDTTSAEMVWSVAEIVAWASQGETLQPGALLGSGTCNGGSTIELGRRLNPGDTIELAIEHLGTATNQLGTPPSVRWQPTPRVRDVNGEAATTFLR